MKRIRVSFTVPEDTFKKFEETSKEMGFKNRSHAISMALHDYTVSHKWRKMRGRIAGAILITYNHHGRINDVLTDIQHDYNDVINASMHIHLTK